MKNSKKFFLKFSKKYLNNDKLSYKWKRNDKKLVSKIAEILSTK